jgi:DME family drug/metabolite transporter
MSGVFWATTMMGMRWLASGAEGSGPAFATVLVGNVVACVACLAFALPVAATARDWAVIGYLGVFQIGAAYLCLTRAIRHVGALEASIILLAEPALNPLWAWLVHDERPGGWALLGGGVILGATVAKTWWDAMALPGPEAATQSPP